MLCGIYQVFNILISVWVVLTWWLWIWQQMKRHSMFVAQATTIYFWKWLGNKSNVRWLCLDQQWCLSIHLISDLGSVSNESHTIPCHYTSSYNNIAYIDVPKMVIKHFNNYIPAGLSSWAHDLLDTGVDGWGVLSSYHPQHVAS